MLREGLRVELTSTAQWLAYRPSYIPVGRRWGIPAGATGTVRRLPNGTGWIWHLELDGYGPPRAGWFCGLGTYDGDPLPDLIRPLPEGSPPPRARRRPRSVLLP